MGNAIEVERKARVADVDGLAERLDRLGRRAGEIDFHDTYFTNADIEGYTFKRFRLRRSGDRATVTFKELLPGGDAVREREFGLDDADGFSALCGIFGMRVVVDKVKRGRVWAVEPGAAPGIIRPARAELIEVVGLGNFIEVEVMVEREDEVSEAERTISAVLNALAVPAAAIERRPYTKMLYERGTE